MAIYAIQRPDGSVIGETVARRGDAVNAWGRLRLRDFTPKELAEVAANDRSKTPIGFRETLRRLGYRKVEAKVTALEEDW